MSDQLNIEELIRSKLDEAEITPSQGAWKGVQRQLRIKKFLRFDPGRFNVFYLSGLLVAGAALVALISTRAPGEDSLELSADPIQNTEEIATGQDNKAPATTGGLESTESKGNNTSQETEKEIHVGEGSVTPAEQTGEDGIQETPPQENTDSDPMAAEETGAAIPVQQTLVTYFTVSAQSGCAPLQVKFTNASVNATSLTWNFGTGEISSDSDPGYLFADPGTYTVALHAEGVDGQRAVHHKVIEVHPVPAAEFEIEQGLEGMDGVESLELMNYSTGAFAFAWELTGSKKQARDRWSSNEFQPSIEVQDLTREDRSVRLVATNNHGCTDTSIVEIPTINGTKPQTLVFPTAFSPNQTGPTGGRYSPHEKRTNLFHPHFADVPGTYNLKVYSRMGELVFESHDIYFGWDGYFQQEKAAVGVYLWVVDGTWEDGSAFNLKGDVTLLWTNRWP